MGYSENVATLQPSATLALAAEARRLRESGRSVVDLSAGEPSFETPPFAARAGVRAIQEGHTGYPPTPGIPELRGAIAEYLSSTTSGPGVQESRVLVSAGVKQALFNCVFCLFGPGDEVLVPAPYWTSYLPQVRLARAEPVVVETRWEEEFRIDPARLEELRTPRTRGLILNSPGNPTGAVYPAETLVEVTDWADRHGIWILSDEIYRRLHYPDDGGSTPAPSLLDMDELPERAVVLDGVSKCFSMTGWRIGFAVGPAELIQKASDLQSQTTSGAVTPAQHAAAAAYGDAERREATIGRFLEALRECRSLGLDTLEGVPGVDARPPPGGMFYYLRLGGRDDSAGAAAELLERSGVACVPGEAFGSHGYLRLNFAVDLDQLEEGLRRFRRFFEDRHGGAA